MVEQAHAGEGHDHIVLIALGNHQIVTDRAAGLCDVLYTGSEGTLNVIAEGEECIAAQSHIGLLCQKCLLILLGQRLGTAGEVVLPNTLGANIFLVAVDITVDHIVTVRATQILTERQVQGLGMLAQEPGISLSASQTGAMDTALLTGTHTDCLAVHGKAYGVGLGVLQGDQRDDQIDGRRLGDLLVCGNDILQQMLADLEIITTLLEGDPCL